MDRKNVDAILAWNAPTSVKDVQTYMSLINFYRHFIKYYSRVIAPMASLLRKGVRYAWTPAASTGFATRKDAFNTTLVITHLDPTLPYIPETDAFDFVASAVLLQKNANGILHPVAFYSH